MQSDRLSEDPYRPPAGRLLLDRPTKVGVKELFSPSLVLLACSTLVLLGARYGLRGFWSSSMLGPAALFFLSSFLGFGLTVAILQTGRIGSADSNRLWAAQAALVLGVANVLGLAVSMIT